MKVAPARMRATKWGALTARLVLGGLDELEGHRQSGGAAARPLRHPWSGGEGGLDRIRGAQVHPVLGRVVVEGQQHVKVVGDLPDGPCRTWLRAGRRTAWPRSGHAACPRRCRSRRGRPSRAGMGLIVYRYLSR